MRCQLTLAMCSAADRVAKIAKERAREIEREKDKVNDLHNL